MSIFATTGVEVLEGGVIVVVMGVFEAKTLGCFAEFVTGFCGCFFGDVDDALDVVASETGCELERERLVTVMGVMVDAVSPIGAESAFRLY